jgi:HPt (histidine-containing phosphotransfer) domain-containing protein
MQVPVELKIKYLKRRIQDIQDLRFSLERDDYSLAMKLGHQVKGNAVTFEFPQMANIGLEIESAAKRKDKERVKILVEKMETVIHSVKQNLPDQLSV